VSRNELDRAAVVKDYEVVRTLEPNERLSKSKNGVVLQWNSARLAASISIPVWQECAHEWTASTHM
jgi:hypothetical protein